jgi:hypothetical protein
MGVFSGPTNSWWNLSGGTDILRTNIATTKTIQSGLVLNLDAGVSNSYTGIGTTFTDLSTSNNNLTLANGPTYLTSNGGNLSFNGIDQWAVKNSHSISLNGGITMDAWVNMNSTTFAATEAAILNHLGYQYLNLNFTKSSQKFRLEYNFGVQLFTTQTITASTWYNLVGVVDNSSGARLYLNGSLTASNATPATLPSTLSSNLFIGYSAGGYVPNMKLAILREYNRPLTAEEVQQNFNATRARFSI